MNKTFIILITLLTVCCNCRANKIDALKTDQDVVNFINSFLSKRWEINKWDIESDLEENFAREILKQQYMPDVRHIYDSLKIGKKKWLKADINNDGKTDLLAFTRYGIITIIADHGSFRLTSDHDSLRRMPDYNNYYRRYHFTFPVVRKINGQNLILVYYLGGGYHAISRIKCDTLIFRDNLFFNYIKGPRHFDIEQIEFHDDGICEGNCLKIDIIIDAKSMTGNYEAKHSRYSDKPYSGQIAKEKVNNILRYFECSNFPDLHEYYIMGDDIPTATWKITYDNGKTKIISDNGGSGSVTLHTLFNYLAGDLLEENK